MPSSRIRIVSICFILLALLFVFKLYLIQIVRSDDYKLLLDRQHLNSTSGIFSRGNIFFKSKDGELISAATVKTGYTVAIIPRIIKNPEDVYEKLNAIIPLEREDFIARATKDDPYEEIATRIPEESMKKIKALNLTGVNLYKSQWRYYPGNDIASHTLGFLAFKGNELAGRYGLERFYENILNRNLSGAYNNFFVEIFSNIKKGFSEEKDSEGDIVTTIEPTVQVEFQGVLEKIHKRYASEETSGIIMDPNTGAIFAMASFPTFDVNNFQNEKSSSVFSNPLVEKVYEMGSIIKPITITAGIDAGVITSKSTYFDQGFVKFEKDTIYNFDRKGRGQVSMQVVLNKSLNTGVAYVENKLGSARFTDYMRKFGIMDKTDIDLPNESSNIVNNLKSPREIEYATASYGQGIALTPISTIRALAVLANGGKLVKPHVVDKIQYRTGIKKTLEFPVEENLIKKESSDEITNMLVEVVDTALLGGKLKNPHYSIATKTGTAQIASPSGGYYSDRYLHSFFGYFPAYDPKFIVLMYTVNPKTELFAADTLAPGFSDLSKFLITYYNLSPDR